MKTTKPVSHQNTLSRRRNDHRTAAKTQSRRGYGSTSAAWNGAKECRSLDAVNDDAEQLSQISKHGVYGLRRRRSAEGNHAISRHLRERTRRIERTPAPSSTSSTRQRHSDRYIEAIRTTTKSSVLDEQQWPGFGPHTYQAAQQDGRRARTETGMQRASTGSSADVPAGTRAFLPVQTQPSMGLAEAFGSFEEPWRDCSHDGTGDRPPGVMRDQQR